MGTGQSDARSFCDEATDRRPLACRRLARLCRAAVERYRRPGLRKFPVARDMAARRANRARDIPARQARTLVALAADDRARVTAPCSRSADAGSDGEPTADRRGDCG